MNHQHLNLYRTPLSWDRGNFFYRITWYFIGRPILSSFLPGTWWRIFLLRAFGSKIGIGCRFKPRMHVTSPWMLRIGNFCWLGEAIWIDNLTHVCLGTNVCISQGVYICTGNHDYRSLSFDLKLGPVLIEDEVWVAANSVLAPGTIIRHGVVVALASVVSGEVPANVIVRGNPALKVGVRLGKN